uniref:Condensin-2 complex subunit H2 C-terminal domain-containing protein n=1 Tax=Anopheles atroparvus TaxID=41427 RepID=A0A240PLJ8_ANOAO
MSRKTNINQHRRLTETGNDVSDDEMQYHNLSAAEHQYPTSSSVATGSTALLTASSTRTLPGVRNAASEQTEHPTVRTGEEIASLLMEVVDKKERCWDFDLHYWLTTYQTVCTEVNFPVAGMLVDCAARIYGRKVDYLSDIVIHMNDDQKGRAQKQSDEGSGENSEEPAQNNSITRKRAGRFNPQSGSDCIDDVEFTCSDTKLLKLDALIKPPTIVEVDRRTKVQQMQDLCTELRANPNRQRRQEILNRLRDEAGIISMLSSHGVARKNQILDLESGETIGTRYDYQIHQNYIDGRTGSLIAEHDLKRFFQRCDVIDLVSEQLESERERCTRLGIPAPADMLSVKAREVKIFLPPEYLRDRYRISVNDTSDFDNALMQARITNYNSDPILTLMDAAERDRRCKQIEEDEATRLNGSGYGNDSAIADEPSFSDVLCSSRLNESIGDTGELQNSTENPSQATLETIDENPVDSELMTLESDASQGKNDGEKPTGTASRLSVDEGIGVDRESPPRSSSTTQEKSANIVFTGGTIIPRQTGQRSVNRLPINLFGIPEKLIQKSCVFSLPVEYRKMKMDLAMRGRDRKPGTSKVNLYSLHPSAPRNPLWVERPSTPDLEDFLGFDDEEAPDVCHPVAKTSNKSLKSKEPPADRSSTPENDFEGFTEEEVIAGVPQSLQLMPKDVENLSSPTRSPDKRQKTGDGASSSQVTPSRTMSCDSGISESAERGKESGSNSEREPLMSEQDDGFDSGLAEHETSPRQPLEEHTEASNARIQERNEEVQERIRKVNRWHKKLKPILIESEKRNHFDIHEYGTQIIDTFDKATAAPGDNLIGDLHRPTITLASVLQNKPAHSTARYFLSMLMLANTNNVEIVNKNRDPLRLSTTDEIELRLISRKRHHQEMEALGELLPSESDPDRGQRKRQNRKRKMMLAHDQDTLQATVVHGDAAACALPDPAARLLSPSDEPNFIDNVRQLYPELNSDESRRKRAAFRRGLRNYAYGLVQGSEETTATDEPQATEPPPQTQPPDPVCNVQPLHSLEEDDILRIDLLTNNATLIATRDVDDMCGRSIFSLAESGYESMISEGNIAR